MGRRAAERSGNRRGAVAARSVAAPLDVDAFLALVLEGMTTSRRPASEVVDELLPTVDLEPDALLRLARAGAVWMVADLHHQARGRGYAPRALAGPSAREKWVDALAIISMQGHDGRHKPLRDFTREDWARLEAHAGAEAKGWREKANVASLAQRLLESGSAETAADLPKSAQKELAAAVEKAWMR